MTDSEKLNLILSDMQSMKADMQNMKSDMQGMKTDMQNMKSDMQNMKSDMQNMKTDMQNMKSDMQGMKTDMQNMKTDMQSMKTDMQNLTERVAVIENKVTDTNLMLENEIRVNIKRVAEGHLDISRNLHEALKIDNEKEMLSIRVNVLESELRRIKERLEIA